MPPSFVAGKQNGLFGPSSKKDWTETALQEVGPGHSLGKLIHQVDGIDILPFYGYWDLPSGVQFQLPSSQNEHKEPRSWSNQPIIQVHDAVSANRAALHYLNAGADGILFELNDNPDPDALLKDIELTICQTSFLLEPGHEIFAEDLSSWVNRKKISQSSIEGAFFWKQSVKDPHGILRWFKGWENFHPLGMISVTSTMISDELASVLAKAVIQIDSTNSGGNSLTDSIRAIAILTKTQKDFFMEVARLKVLRALFLQVATGFDPTFKHSLPIHAMCEFRTDSKYEPHGNLIAGSLEGLSAVIGGCDALTVVDPEQNRIALNISSVIKEEGHLGKVADPAAGSYFLENIQDKLAQETWRKFQAAMK